jgi:hypothetical protein
VWEAASGRELLTLKGHRPSEFFCGFSPDGQRIVTGSADQTAKVWDAASGRELLTLKGHSGVLWSVAFSPDGQRIVTGSNDHTAKVWDAATAENCSRSRDTRRCFFCGLFPRWAADSHRQYRSYGQGMGFRQRQTGTAHAQGAQRRPSFCSLFPGRPTDCYGQFGYDGQGLGRGKRRACGRVNSEHVHVQGTRQWGLFRCLFPGRSADSHVAVTDGTARCGTRPAGKELLTLKGHGNVAYSAAFSPDGQRIVTGSSDGTAKVWQAASGKELLTLKGHSERVFSVTFSPDGQRIVTGSLINTAKVWDAASGRELLTLKGHSGVKLVCGLFPRRPAHCHRQWRSYGQGVGGGQRARTAHAQGAQRWDYGCGLLPGWPADCHWQSWIRPPRCGKRPAAGNCSRSRGAALRLGL